MFGLGRPYLSQNSVYTNLCDYDELGRLATNNICERGVFLSRVLDGISFLSVANNESVDEGFGIAFGSYGKIRSFVFIWPNLERDKLSQTASSQEIIACIKARKTIVSPKDDEPNYFARLTNLAKTKVFTITKITPFYVEGVLGEKPADDGPSKIIAPIAELEGVADFGNSNLTVRLFSPILSSDVNRLLGK